MSGHSKPTHLGRQYAAQFDDEAVARVYHTRPAYPAELFEILAGLIPPGSRDVLDLGCGTGDIALGLVGRADRIDAIDASAAMLHQARAREASDHPSLHWIQGAAETFVPTTRYSLVVAAESLHWMEWPDVFAWIPKALQPGAYLALVTGRELTAVPWAGDLARLLPQYSTNQDYRPFDLVAELAGRGLFAEAGRRTTRAVPVEQTVDDYVESFHSRNGFSRARMTEQAAALFDQALRALVTTHCPGGIVSGLTRATVVFGVPRAPRQTEP